MVLAVSVEESVSVCRLGGVCVWHSLTTVDSINLDAVLIPLS
jgi:hypothetical protein